MLLELSQRVITVRVQLLCSWLKGLVIHFGKDFFLRTSWWVIFLGCGVFQCFLSPEILTPISVLRDFMELVHHL